MVEAGEQRDEALRLLQQQQAQLAAVADSHAHTAQQVDCLANDLQQAQASLKHYQARTCLQTVSLFPGHLPLCWDGNRNDNSDHARGQALTGTYIGKWNHEHHSGKLQRWHCYKLMSWDAGSRAGAGGRGTGAGCSERAGAGAAGQAAAGTD